MRTYRFLNPEAVQRVECNCIRQERIQSTRQFKTVLDGFNCENNAFLVNVRNMMREMFMKFQNRRNQVGSVDFVQGVMPAIYEFFKKKTEYNDLHDVMRLFVNMYLTALMRIEGTIK